ncbi:pseudouridine-5'-phosphatase-like [Drosophila novamexicana]|uniref:pseudouridine-5'-phosphatase-like n=1 Tax=Drosophila novamexicana TaxID=47314 RepID=UPI0011E5DA29|nr:pseudouridine-5'-phosphatase-like [Drosophila novamexicana]
MSTTTPKCFQKVTQVIFDNDGTLMDTENMYTEAVQDVLTPYGQTYTYELKMRCMGKLAPVAAELMINEFNLPLTVPEYMAKFEAEVARRISNVALMPGVRELLLHLFEFRVPMAIATSSFRKTFNLKARPHCELMPVFHHIVCGDDPELKAGKPAPDIFLLAASRFKPKPRPECCLVFEDSPAGLQAGLAAGMQVVMIPDPRFPAESTKDATLVLRSMSEFQPELFGLPELDNISKFTFG